MLGNAQEIRRLVTGHRSRGFRAVPLMLPLLVSSCTAATPGEFGPDPVYRALFTSIADSLGDGARVVIDPRTSAPDHAAQVIDGWIGAPGSVIRAYRSANAESIELTRTDFPLPFIDEHVGSRRDANDPDTWYQQLADTHGGRPTVLIVSRPGFARDGRRAVIHYELYCGRLCASYHVAELEVRADTWLVIRHFTYGIS